MPPPQRVLAFAGICNFRDIGGYATQSGVEVRWGRIYRAGVLTYIDANDKPRAMELGVRAICDLRRLDERQREPTDWPDRQARAVHWDDGGAPPTIRTIATRHPNTAAGMHAAMCDLYRALPEWLAPRLRGVIDSVVNDEAPLIVHCAAGKDRTGIVIALLLAALEVPREVIVRDYLLTNEAGDFEQFLLTRQHAQLGLAVNQHPLMALPDDVRKVLFAADAAYLTAAFEQIERDYGDVATYLRERVGLTPALRSQLHAAALATA